MFGEIQQTKDTKMKVVLSVVLVAVLALYSVPAVAEGLGDSVTSGTSVRNSSETRHDVVASSATKTAGDLKPSVVLTAGPECFHSVRNPYGYSASMAQSFFQQYGSPCMSKFVAGACQNASFYTEQVRGEPVSHTAAEEQMLKMCDYIFSVDLAIALAQPGASADDLALALKSVTDVLGYEDSYAGYYALSRTRSARQEYGPAVDAAKRALEYEMPDEIRQTINTFLADVPARVAKQQDEAAKQKQALAEQERQKADQQRLVALAREQARKDAIAEASAGVDVAVAQVNADAFNSPACTADICPPVQSEVDAAAQRYLGQNYPGWDILTVVKVNGQLGNLNGFPMYVAVVEFVIQTRAGMNPECDPKAIQDGDTMRCLSIRSQGKTVALPGTWIRQTINLPMNKTERGWQ